MKPIVNVFGTDHRYQRRSEELTHQQHDQFELIVSKVVQGNSVALLAEENSQEALEWHGRTESTVRTIARKLGVSHLYCDPDRTARIRHFIEQESDVRVSGFLRNWSESQIQRQVEESFRKRERYWKQRLLEQNRWPVLFICGANHASRFCTLLRESHIQARLLAEDWSAEL